MMNSYFVLDSLNLLFLIVTVIVLFAVSIYQGKQSLKYNVIFVAFALSMIGAIIVEIILTFVFIYTILGVTSDDSKSSIAGVVIGLTLTFVHIMGIPLTGTSVNPARSLAPAVLLGGQALSQVWVFIVAPFVGSALAALTFKGLNSDK